MKRKYSHCSLDGLAKVANAIEFAA